jgi:hypothetical protein
MQDAGGCQQIFLVCLNAGLRALLLNEAVGSAGQLALLMCPYRRTRYIASRQPCIGMCCRASAKVTCRLLAVPCRRCMSPPAGGPSHAARSGRSVCLPQVRPCSHLAGLVVVAVLYLARLSVSLLNTAVHACSSMAVDKALRRQGAAQALLSASEEMAGEHCCLKPDGAFHKHPVNIRLVLPASAL